MTLQPLRKNRDFVLLQVGQTLSAIGSESTGIAYPLLVLAVTHSPVEAGLVGFARVLPWALFGFLAGVAVDRFKRKRMMIVSDLMRASAVTSIVVAVALHRLTFAQIAIVAFLEGSMYVFFNVAEIGALRSVVPSRQLPAAAAAEQARFSTVTIVAPPLGGALFGVARALPFLADAFSYVFSLGSLLAIRTPFQEEREAETASLRSQLAEGFRWLWNHRFLRTCALLFTWVNMLFEGTFLVLIVVGRRQGLSGGEIGALIAAVGFVALAGSLASPRLQRRVSMRQFVVGSLWLQLTLVAFVVKPSIYVLVVATLPAAFFGPERERRRDRLPRRGRPGPAHRPREQRRAHDRTLRPAARPARCRPAPRLVLRENDDRGLRQLPPAALRLRDAQLVDPQRTEPRRARRPA